MLPGNNMAKEDRNTDNCKNKRQNAGFENATWYVPSTVQASKPANNPGQHYECREYRIGPTHAE
ncbi:hypothetical protein GCM10009570_05340 [Dietzia natronolimnaea]